MPIRKEHTLSVLAKAKNMLVVTEKEKARATEIMQFGVKPLDALHFEINQQAIRLLYKELGVADAVRFLKQYTQGFGNYTQERKVIFANKSLDDIVSQIEKRRKTAQ